MRRLNPCLDRVHPAQTCQGQGARHVHRVPAIACHDAQHRHRTIHGNTTHESALGHYVTRVRHAILATERAVIRSDRDRIVGEPPLGRLRIGIDKKADSGPFLTTDGGKDTADQTVGIIDVGMK